MIRILRYIMMAIIVAFAAETAYAQGQVWREIHKVKKKETIFGIARQYGLTIQELIDANPDMNKPDYELKKDTYINIPFAKTATPTTTVAQPVAVAQPEKKADDRRDPNTVRLGVMLPLHDNNGDGRRMVEYYRGVLMACDSLKKLGYSIDVHAWNTPEDKDIAPVLRDKAAQKCDFIFGPLYSKQMTQLSEFVQKNDIRLVIPFSINAPELLVNRNIFQIYQPQSVFIERVISQFLKQFQGYHPVFIDCNDTTSQKGIFTFGLRRQLELKGVEYSITNLKSSEAQFAKSFSTTKPNVVILNTGRSPELNVTLAKLDGLTTMVRGLQITLFGYTEWMMYTKYQLDNFYKYNTYIPAAYHYNPLTSRTMRLEQKYRSNFRQDMMTSQPRFALTGFDHTMYFVQGFKRYGKSFTGAPGMVAYEPVQTPLKFDRIGNGGLRNESLVFVHYLPEHRMETINF